MTRIVQRSGPPAWEEAPPEVIARAHDDRAAFGALYDLYVRRVYVFCALHSATREEAEDLTALTFERALRAIVRYEERGRPFSSWLLRIAAHLAADRARHAQPVTVSGDDGVDPDALTPNRRQGEDWATQWETAAWLRGHLDALPAEQRRVVQLRYYEGCDFTEIGARLGRSAGAAKQLLRRALRGLRVRIQEEALSDG